MGSKGAKEIVQEVINFYKINREGYPYELIYKLTQLYQVIEDAYSVSTMIELQEAIDSIGTGAGTIFIAAGTYDVETTIDIDGCGSLVIYGHGDNTILKAADGITVFNITCCTSCIIKSLKIDIDNYTILNPNTQAVIVNETNNNVVALQDVSFLGDGSYGYGIEINSDNCSVVQCNILSCKIGIYINAAEKNLITNNVIGLHAQYGLYLANSSDSNTITGNSCVANGVYGIYLNNADYCILSNNGCNSNKTGLYLTASYYDSITSSAFNSNSENGIYITGGDYNTISSNTVSNNDSNTAVAQAGVYLDTVNYSTITGNTVNNNNNAGAGTGYGIYIASGSENVIAANNANGNDIDFYDGGVGTQIIYYVQNADELQDAIDSIGAKAGTIHMTTGTITLSATINVDGGGTYIIEGEGGGSIVDNGGDRSAFYVTNAASGTTFKNFKIDGSAITLNDPDCSGIQIEEVNDNIIIVDNVTGVGDTVNKKGYGIHVSSNNVIIQNCNFSYFYRGFAIFSAYCFVQTNHISNNDRSGFYLGGTSTYATVGGNISENNDMYGITAQGDKHTIINNICYGNTLNGMRFYASDYNTVSGNIIHDNNLNSATSGGGIKFEVDSNNNTIVANNIYGNVNAGAGTAYGIWISINTCDNNIINGNSISGNDVDILDVGTNTDIEYRVSTEGELQNAIDSIGAKSGLIHIVSGTLTLSATIDIDGGGYYTIEGEGNGTNLTPNTDITVFDISNCKSCVLKNFLITTNAITTEAKPIIFINEVNAWFCDIDNILIYNTIVAKKGIGIYNIDSPNYHTIHNCVFNGLHTGVHLFGDDSQLSELEVVDCTMNNMVIGIYVDNVNYCLFSGNSMLSLDDDAIYLNTCLSSIISNNKMAVIAGNGITMITCSYLNINGNIVAGYDYGINGTTIVHCVISGNMFMDSNVALSGFGIYLNAATNTIISNNHCTDNVGNTAVPSGGIVITTNSNNNNIIGNTSSLNTNSGAGIGYGIYIATANCSDNIVRSNNIFDNTIQLWDNGTNTDIEYQVSTATELQDAINSIAAKKGIIYIDSGTFTINTEININGGGEYTIIGEGRDSTILTCALNIRGFDITSAKYCEIRHLRVDMRSWTIACGAIGSININEGSDRPVVIDDVYVLADDATFGYGIAIYSNNVTIKNSKVVSSLQGIFLDTANFTTIESNEINGSFRAIVFDSNSNAENNIITKNHITGVNSGIGVYTTCDYNIISHNHILDYSNVGMYILGDYCLIMGNVVGDTDGSMANPNGIFISNGGGVGGRYCSLIGNMCYNINTSGGGTGTAYVFQSTSAKSLGNVQQGCDREYWRYSGSTDLIHDFNTREYYAKDKDEIQDAIDTAETAGESCIIYITEDFTTDESIDIGAIDNSVSIIIDGRGWERLITCNTGDSMLFNIDATNSDAKIYIRNMTINIASVAATFSCFRVSATHNIIIENVHMIGAGAARDHKGIHMINADYATVKECKFDTLRYGIYMDYYSRYCYIENNVFIDIEYDGINIQLNTTACNYNTFIGNYFYNCKLRGIFDDDGTAYNKYIGNTFNACNTNSGTSGGGIWLDTNSDYNLIVNNVFYGCANAGAGTGYAIRINHANCGNNKIGGNHFNNNDNDISDAGTSTIIMGDDTAFAASWNANLGTPTKNAVYDKAIAQDAIVDAISITNMPTAVNNWKMFSTNGAGVMTELAVGAAGTVLTGNGAAAAPSFQAAGAGSVPDRIYYVDTDAELDTAITAIEAGNYEARIIIREDLTNVQATLNDASASYIIEGSGGGVTLDANGNNAIFTITACDSLVIRNITFDLTDHTAVGTPCIDINGGTDITIENCNIIGDNTNSIGITIDTATKVLILNNRITDTCDGIYINTDDNLIKGNVITSTADDGIHVASAADRNLIIGNVIRSVGDDGIFVDSGADDNQLSDNIITGSGGSRVADAGNNTIYGARYS